VPKARENFQKVFMSASKFVAEVLIFSHIAMQEGEEKLLVTLMNQLQKQNERENLDTLQRELYSMLFQSKVNLNPLSPWDASDEIPQKHPCATSS
jgi:hypothetical protein